jgi:hypothetical protein
LKKEKSAKKGVVSHLVILTKNGVIAKEKGDWLVSKTQSMPVLQMLGKQKEKFPCHKSPWSGNQVAQLGKKGKDNLFPGLKR